VDSVDAAGLIREYLRLPLPLSGRLGLSVSMTGAVDSTLEVVLKQVDAQGLLSMPDGEIVNWSWLKSVASGAGQIAFLGFDRIQLSALRAPFRVRDERLFLDRLTVRADDILCALSGSGGFDGTLDIQADIDMPARRIGSGGLNLGSALGSLPASGDAIVPVRLKLTGTASSPHLALDLQQASKDEVQRRVQDLGSSLKGEVKSGIRKMLGR
jgi:hypothetical protein